MNTPLPDLSNWAQLGAKTRARLKSEAEAGMEKAISQTLAARVAVDVALDEWEIAIQYEAHKMRAMRSLEAAASSQRIRRRNDASL